MVSGNIAKQEAQQLVGQAKRSATKINSKQSEAAFSTVFFQENSRPEVIGHVISGVAVLVKFGDSTSDHSPDIRAAHFVMDDT